MKRVRRLEPVSDFEPNVQCAPLNDDLVVTVAYMTSSATRVTNVISSSSQASNLIENTSGI